MMTTTVMTPRSAIGTAYGFVPGSPVNLRQIQISSAATGIEYTTIVASSTARRRHGRWSQSSRRCSRK